MSYIKSEIKYMEESRVTCVIFQILADCISCNIDN